MSFISSVTAAQTFAETSAMFGEDFVYMGATLRGIFSQVTLDYEFEEASFRRVAALVCVTSKAQWVSANIVPANRGEVIYSGQSYPIQEIAGLNSPGEPAYTLTMFQTT